MIVSVNCFVFRFYVLIVPIPLYTENPYQINDMGFSVAVVQKANISHIAIVQ